MVTFHCHVMFSFFLGGVIWSINETKPHWWLTYLWWLELVWKPLQTFFLATGGFGFCNFVLNVAAEKTQWGSPFIHIFLTKNFLSFTTLHIAPLEKELGGGFKCFWNFHPYLGKISILTINFTKGLKPPTREVLTDLLGGFTWLLFFVDGYFFSVVVLRNSEEFEVSWGKELQTEHERVVPEFLSWGHCLGLFMRTSLIPVNIRMCAYIRKKYIWSS